MATTINSSSFAQFCRQQRKYQKLVNRSKGLNPELGYQTSYTHEYSPETETPLPSLWVPSFVELIGDTPLLDLTHIMAEKLKRNNVRILAKLEMLNPGLCSESRTINYLLSEALFQGILKNGMIIVSVSSSSTFDAALAMLCARSGFKCIIVANSEEKYNSSNWKLVHIYGGSIAMSDDVELELERIKHENEGRIFDMSQFQKSHPKKRFAEIISETLEQTNGMITHLVTEEKYGMSKPFLSQELKRVEIYFSHLEKADNNAKYYPNDIAVSDEEAIVTCHNLSTLEGICAGKISGVNVFASLKLASRLKNAVIVTNLPDIGIKHLDDFFNSKWLEQNGLSPMPSLESMIPFPKEVTTVGKPLPIGNTFDSFQMNDIIGETPLIDLTHMLSRPRSGVRVLAKVEYFNPGFSIKDRIVRHIFNEAEKRGMLRPGMTVVAASSGNTGAATAMLCAARGYSCVITTSPKCSQEKMDTIRAYGAKLLVSPPGAKEGTPAHYMNMATALADENPDWFDVNQYDNLDNAAAHYHSLAPEIWRQTQGQITHFVAAGSTGGTISGTAKYLKEKNPEIKAILADPIGSIFSNYYKTGEIGTPGKFLVEGVGKGSIPGCINFGVIDDIFPVSDEEAFTMCWRLARKEGICPGGSGGLNLHAALNYAETVEEPATIVTVFPDSGAKYLSKVYNKSWLKSNQLKSVTETADLF